MVGWFRVTPVCMFQEIVGGLPPAYQKALQDKDRQIMLWQKTVKEVGLVKDQRKSFQATVEATFHVSVTLPCSCSGSLSISVYLAKVLAFSVSLSISPSLCLSLSDSFSSSVTLPPLPPPLL